MLYVGIDQSYSGFAVAFYDRDKESHWEALNKFDGNGVDRLLKISGWLKELLSPYTDDLGEICMEGYSAGSRWGREKSGELGAVVKMTLRTSTCNTCAYPTIVQPTSLKKFVTGAGTGKKNVMLLGVYKKWGAEFTDDNKADAYALSRMAEAIAHPEMATLKYEQDTLAKVRVHTERPLT